MMTDLYSAFRSEDTEALGKQFCVTCRLRLAVDASSLLMCHSECKHSCFSHPRRLP